MDFMHLLESYLDARDSLARAYRMPDGHSKDIEVELAQDSIRFYSAEITAVTSRLGKEA